MWTGRPLFGFFVHLDWDERREGQPHNELRLLIDAAISPETALDVEYGLVPIPLILEKGNVDDALARVIASGAAEAARHGYGVHPGIADAPVVARALAPLISLTLYLCSEIPDWDLEPPKNPPTVKTKQGPRTFPVPQPRVWDVGVRIGAALRSAEASASEPSGTHAGPRAHIRRAHWHTYLTGTGRSKRVFHWLPPIPVNMESLKSLPATVREVD
jgi:hypothetical protein